MNRPSDPRPLHADTRAGWDHVAVTKYRDELPADVALLRAGGHTLLPIELDHLATHLAHVNHAVHLQCSHGLDALGLLNLGVRQVTGVDISAEMIRLAEEKTHALGARARWVCADVLDTPYSLDGTADLVFTGKGAMPRSFDTEDALVAYVGATPGAIGYVSEEKAGAAVKFSTLD